MRHRVYGKHFSRNKDERKALIKGLVFSLFSHGSIETSEIKAKAIKGFVDKIINLAKNQNAKLQLQSYLNNKALQERLIKEVLPNLGARNSGYTKVVRLGTRVGDQTMMVKMSLIGSEELKPLTKEPVKKEIIKAEKAEVKPAVRKASTTRRKVNK